MRREERVGGEGVRGERGSGERKGEGSHAAGAMPSASR